VFQPAQLGESAVVRSSWSERPEPPDPAQPTASRATPESEPPPRPGRRKPSRPSAATAVPELIVTQNVSTADSVSPRGFLCPFCHSPNPPRVSSQITTAGWIVFTGLLVACFPLCFLGFFLREERHHCADCGIRLGGG